MKRTFIYTSIIVSFLMLAQFEHWRFIESMSGFLGNHNYSDSNIHSVKRELDKFDLLDMWAGMAARLENRDTSKFEIRKWDSYTICDFTKSESQIYIVLLTSPPDEDSVQVYKGFFKTSRCENAILEMELLTKSTQYVRDKFDVNKQLIHKKDLIKEVRKANYVKARVFNYNGRGLLEKIITFPLLIPILVVLIFIIIWVGDKISLFLEVILRQPRYKVLGLIVIIITLLDTLRMVKIYQEGLAFLNQVWNTNLMIYTLVSLSLI